MPLKIGKSLILCLNFTFFLKKVRKSEDDAHIFALEENLGTKITNIIKIIEKIYKVFGFKNYYCR